MKSKYSLSLKRTCLMELTGKLIDSWVYIAVGLQANI